MSGRTHPGMASPGLAKGDFVPLPVTQFQKAYVTVVRSVAGLLPPDPTFPSTIFDAVSGKPQPYPDTAMHRAWYAGGKLFTDEAERMSFYWLSLLSSPTGPGIGLPTKRVADAS